MRKRLSEVNKSGWMDGRRDMHGLGGGGHSIVRAELGN
jgi:hypothetical protein